MAVLSIALQGLSWPRFPGGAVPNEEIALRWIHITAGTLWIGLLYFLQLIERPAAREGDVAAHRKIFPGLMKRAMWWFRWSALITALVGMRYFWLMLATDAQNASNSWLAPRWLGEWFGVWLASYALIYPLQMPRKGLLDKPWVRALGISLVTIAGAVIALELNANVPVSNAHLSICVGGGLGLLMLLNTWGPIWRAQKRLIFWTSELDERGTPIPERAVYLERWSLLAMTVTFWMSFPMLFFMSAAGHYVFLFTN